MTPVVGIINQRMSGPRVRSFFIYIRISAKHCPLKRPFCKDFADARGSGYTLKNHIKCEKRHKEQFSCYFCNENKYRCILAKRLYILVMMFVALSARGQIIVDESTEMTGAPVASHGVKYAGMVEFEGEMIPWFVFDDVYCFNKLEVKSKRTMKKYYKMVNNIKKVYPIAVEIKKTIDKTVAHLDSLPNKKAKDEYMDKAEKELKKQYTPKLKKLTFSQGKLLIKLIDRQCNHTSYELIKMYMGGFKAGFYNMFASLFGASLKKEYDPEVDDRLTERCILLIESGQM